MIDAAVFFFVTLAICYAVVCKSAFVQTTMTRFADFLLGKSFPGTSDFEHVKFGFLRIIFGFLLLNRAINIFVWLLPSEYFTAVGLWSMADIVAAVLVMTGLFTQWALLFLIFFMWHIGEVAMSTSTLGNDIAACLSLLLFLTNAGKTLSLDGLLIRRFNKLGRWLLYFDGIPNHRTMALAKFAALLSYFTVCVFSLAVHLNEHAWTTGIGGVYVFTNNFMSSIAEPASQLFVNNPWAVFAARCSLWVMMLWYPTLLPFTLMGGILRSYVIYWGLIFLCLSSFVLLLGSLAEFEFVFWAGLFWASTGLDSKRKLSVYYDDTCNLCDRTMWVITRLDIFNRVQLCPLSSHGKKLETYGVKPEAALENLYGVEEANNQVKFGYDFYLLLARNLFLLWPVLPVLYAGKILFIGPMIYAMIAKKRHALFGVCKLPSHKVIREWPVVSNTVPQFAKAIVLHVCLLAVFYFVAIPAPYLNYAGIQTSGSVASAFYGMAPINVFNHEDMRMAENWFTIKDIKNDTLLPIFTEKGTRLKAHRSDRLYFGNTLMYRRGNIDTVDCLFNQSQNTMSYLAKVYLHSLKATAGKYGFEYVQYHQDLPDDKKILAGEFIIPKTETRCHVTFEIDYSP